MDDIILDEDTVLSGYIDDALNNDMRAYVAAQLLRDPIFAARLETLRRNDSLVKIAYNQPMHEALPLSLVKRLTGAKTTHPPVRHERSASHDDTVRATRCWLLPKRVAKPLVRLYHKHSR